MDGSGAGGGALDQQGAPHEHAPMWRQYAEDIMISIKSDIQRGRTLASNSKVGTETRENRGVYLIFVMLVKRPLETRYSCWEPDGASICTLRLCLERLLAVDIALPQSGQMKAGTHSERAGDVSRETHVSRRCGSANGSSGMSAFSEWCRTGLASRSLYRSNCFPHMSQVQTLGPGRAIVLVCAKRLVCSVAEGSEGTVVKPLEDGTSTCVAW